MKKVVMYQAEDGTFHESENAARECDNLQKASLWYVDHTLYGRQEGCKIEWDEFISWLNENRSAVSNIIAGL